MNLISTIKSFFNYFTLYAGGGGAPAQQNVTTTSIPEYARPYVEKSLGQAAALTDINQNPYQPYGGQQVAAFSPLQSQAMQNLSNQGVASQIAEGSNIASQVGQYALQTPERARQLQNASLGYGAQGANLGILGGGLYGAQAAGAGSQYAGMATDPSSINAYMSPYMQNAVDVQKQEAIRDYQKTMPTLGAQAVKSGAFGGSRQAIVDAEAQRNVNRQLANIQATGSQQAYDQAMRSMQFGSTLGLQGLQTGLQGVNTQLAGTGQGMQGVQGAVGAGQYGLAGLNTAGQAASTLGSLGQTQFQQEMAIADAQMRAGAMQQAQEQKGLDILQQQYTDSLNYPYKQLGFMSDIYRGLPLTQGAQSMYQNPSAISQAAGLGTAAYGLYQMGKKNGGVIKMADGGITQLFDVGGEVKSDLYEMSPEDLQAYIKKSSSATAKKMAMQILAEKQFQERQQGSGVTALPSNLPVGGMANGGIIAFAEGDVVEDPLITALRQDPLAQFSGLTPETLTTDTARIEKIKADRAAAAAAQNREFLSRSAPHLLPPVATVEKEPVELEDPRLAAGIVGIPNRQPGQRDQRTQGAPSTGKVANLPVTTDEIRSQAAAGKGSALDQYAAMLMAEREGSGKERDKAKAMAIFQAGLGIAGGTSPNPFANIAQGALPATQAYQQELRGIRKEDSARIKELMGLGISKEKLALEAKKLGISEKRFDQMYELEKQKIGIMGGSRADSRAQSEELKRLSVAQGLFATLRKDQLMSGLSDEQLWSQAQRMAGQAGVEPSASSSSVMGTYTPGKGYIPK